MITYCSILRAEEAAGLERATGAGAFTPDGFDRRQYDRFVSLGSAQNGFIAMARRYAGSAQIAKLDEFAASAAEKAVREMRGSADRAALERAQGVDPLAWFRAATQRIDAMKALEDESSTELKRTVGAAAEGARGRLKITSALIVAVAAFAAFAARWIAASITRPLVALTSEMSLLARGDTSRRMIADDRDDEIGAMMRAVVVFRENAIERARLEETARAERQNEFRRQAALEEMIGRFRNLIGEVVASVDAEAKAMSGTARTLSDVAFRAGQAADSARSAASDSSENIHTVSAAAEELTASITEISRQIHGTSERVSQTTELARHSDRTISGLAELAEKIGAIVEMIRVIAQKTNMLALNATIEAARAGNAGNGFAVVASEVKSLASQTANATDDITHQIAEIQAATRGAVEEVRVIARTVAEIDALTIAVATAVEEQNAATAEIARAISGASSSSAMTSENVESVASVIEQNNSEANRVSNATGLLSASSRKLATAVDAFLVEMTKDVQDRRAAARRRTTHGVVILNQGGRIETRLLDLSDTGAKFLAVDALKEGDRFNFEFEDRARTSAKLVWSKDGYSGAQFDQPLSNISSRDAA